MSDFEPSPLEGETSELEEPTPHRQHRRTSWYIEWLAVIAVTLSLFVLSRTYVAQTFFIPSSSMVPTLQIGDRIVVSKLSVAWGTIHRGDIVVFHSPANVAQDCDSAHEAFLVKRVIGLPGEHIRSVGNTIYVNDRAIRQAWKHAEPLGKIITAVTIPANSYFMLGDNQFDSCDSRYWGTVKRSMIIGKAFVRIWPPSRIGFL
jgi:signal peptidase I